MPKPFSSISVFFPCYNDSKTIGKLVQDSNTLLHKLKVDYEIIVVNDGSTDSSQSVLSRLAKKYPRLRVIQHSRNRGYGGALASGFKASRKQVVFYTDGDGQYDPTELRSLIPLLTQDIDFVNGMKISRSDSLLRIVAGNLYNFAVRWIFWLPTFDVDCDFRLIRTSIINKIKLNCRSGAVCVELVTKAQKAGAKFSQVSVHHYPRQFGGSQFFKPREIISTFWELILLKFGLL